MYDKNVFDLPVDNGVNIMNNMYEKIIKIINCVCLLLFKSLGKTNKQLFS